MPRFCKDVNGLVSWKSLFLLQEITVFCDTIGMSSARMRAIQASSSPCSHIIIGFLKLAHILNKIETIFCLNSWEINYIVKHALYYFELLDAKKENITSLMFNNQLNACCLMLILARIS